MKRVAKLISWLFLPLLAPVYALLIVLYTPCFSQDSYQISSLYFLDDQAKKVLLYLFGFFSFIAPSLTVLFLQTRGMVTSVMMDNRRERVIPSFMVILYGISLLSILLYKVPSTFTGAPHLYGLALGSLIAVVLCTLATLRWKISLHATGMGILSGFVFIYSVQMIFFPLWILIGLFIISGIVMSARMILSLHDIKQLVAGYLVGVGGVILGELFFIL